jgi:DNA-binding response OmpR family regulator
MLYFHGRMPVVYVIARDWTLRTAVRAELRETGIDALGMQSPEDVGRVIASGAVPAVVVLEAVAKLASDPAIQKLVERIPTVLIASRTETVSLPAVAAVLYRPVRIADVIARVRELLARTHSA